MCRLLLISGSNVRLAKSLLEALSRASQEDPYLRRISERGSYRHDDGWGYALVGVLKGSMVSRYYRSCDPIFEDAELFSLTGALERFEIFHLIAHSRKISKGGKELRNTHPFHYSHLGSDFWFAHNGTVDDIGIAAEMEWKYDGSLSDSHYLGRFFYESIGDNFNEASFKSAFEHVKKFLKPGSALNTISIFCGRGKPIAAATCYYESEDEEKKDYYRLYLHEGSYLRAIASSTLLLYAGSIEFNEIESGGYVIFDMP